LKIEFTKSWQYQPLKFIKEDLYSSEERCPIIKYQLTLNKSSEHLFKEHYLVLSEEALFISKVDTLRQELYLEASTKALQKYYVPIKINVTHNKVLINRPLSF
jgi:hypothetical protein